MKSFASLNVWQSVTAALLSLLFVSRVNSLISVPGFPENILDVRPEFDRVTWNSSNRVKVPILATFGPGFVKMFEENSEFICGFRYHDVHYVSNMNKIRRLLNQSSSFPRDIVIAELPIYKPKNTVEYQMVEYNYPIIIKDPITNKDIPFAARARFSIRVDLDPIYEDVQSLHPNPDQLEKFFRQARKVYKNIYYLDAECKGFVKGVYSVLSDGTKAFGAPHNALTVSGGKKKAVAFSQGGDDDDEEYDEEPVAVIDNKNGMGVTYVSDVYGRDIKIEWTHAYETDGTVVKLDKNDPRVDLSSISAKGAVDAATTGANGLGGRSSGNRKGDKTVKSDSETASAEDEDRNEGSGVFSAKVVSSALVGIVTFYMGAMLF